MKKNSTSIFAVDQIWVKSGRSFSEPKKERRASLSKCQGELIFCSVLFKYFRTELETARSDPMSAG